MGASAPTVPTAPDRRPLTVDRATDRQGRAPVPAAATGPSGGVRLRPRGPSVVPGHGPGGEEAGSEGPRRLLQLGAPDDAVGSVQAHELRGVPPWVARAADEP